MAKKSKAASVSGRLEETATVITAAVKKGQTAQQAAEATRPAAAKACGGADGLVMTRFTETGEDSVNVTWRRAVKVPDPFAGMRAAALAGGAPGPAAKPKRAKAKAKP